VESQRRARRRRTKRRLLRRWAISTCGRMEGGKEVKILDRERARERAREREREKLGRDSPINRGISTLFSLSLPFLFRSGSLPSAFWHQLIMYPQTECMWGYSCLLCLPVQGLSTPAIFHTNLQTIRCKICCQRCQAS
jgi:hypothetical protein